VCVCVLGENFIILLGNDISTPPKNTETLSNIVVVLSRTMIDEFSRFR